jgi:hypothetical protein
MAITNKRAGCPGVPSLGIEPHPSTKKTHKPNRHQCTSCERAYAKARRERSRQAPEAPAKAPGTVPGTIDGRDDSGRPPSNPCEVRYSTSGKEEGPYASCAKPKGHAGKHAALASVRRAKQRAAKAAAAA